MAPPDLRQKSKYEEMLECLLIMMTAEERDWACEVHDRLTKEKAVQVLRGRVNEQPEGAALQALAFIRYYTGHGPRPAALRSITELWRENWDNWTDEGVS